MRRLPRIPLNVATAVSLVLCVSTVALWVRSYWVGENYYITRPDGYFGFESEHGNLGVHRRWERTDPSSDYPSYYRRPVPDPYPIEQNDLDDPGLVRFWRFAGVRFRTSRGGQKTALDPSYLPIWSLDTPHWLPALLFAVPPAFWVRSRIKRHTLARRQSCPGPESETMPGTS